jgi:carbon starvation protein CstA
MKYKIVFILTTLVLAAFFGQVVKFLADDNLDEWSIRFAVAAVALFIGYLWGKGELLPIIKEEPLQIIVVSTVFIYFLSALAPLIVIFTPALLCSHLLCQKFFSHL